MLAGCELLQRGGNGTGATAVSRVILYTDSPVENNNTYVGGFFLLVHTLQGSFEFYLL